MLTLQWRSRREAKPQLNNAFFVSEIIPYWLMKHTQIKKFGSRFIGTELPIPPLADVARAFGAYSEKVETPDQIIPSVKRAMSSGKFALLDVILDSSDDNLVPPGSFGAEGWH